MKKFVRKYKTLKFFRGKRKDNELKKLSKEKKDFQYRRLLIEECEKDLNTIFTKKIIFEIIGFLFLYLSLINHKTIFFNIFILVCVFFLFISLFQKRKYKKTLIKYKKSFIIVDNVIKKEYGISLPTYL